MGLADEPPLINPGGLRTSQHAKCSIGQIGLAMRSTVRFGALSIPGDRLGEKNRTPIRAHSISFSARGLTSENVIIYRIRCTNFATIGHHVEFQ
jgi:hypothetical protein